MTKIPEDYQKYVKKELWNKFKNICRINSLDVYSSSILQSTIKVMENLMVHTFKGDLKKRKMSVKRAWLKGIEKQGHSAMSAACVAITVVRFSPRGEEFEKWCKKNNTVMVDWEVDNKK